MNEARSASFSDDALRAERGNMQTLRTADERFVGLPGYAFEPHYADRGASRMHYLDEGAKTAPVALCLHGQPTWGYLYRKMIPAFSLRDTASSLRISSA